MLLVLIMSETRGSHESVFELFHIISYVKFDRTRQKFQLIISFQKHAL